jgi:hypothetical protein
MGISLVILYRSPMFPGWSVEMLFSPYPEELAEPADFLTPFESAGISALGDAGDAPKFSDLAGAYVRRAEFTSAFPLFDLLAAASLVRASGVSLNLLTQHYSDVQIRRLVKNGTRFQLIFLDPDSDAMKLREEEEGYSRGLLRGLTETNIRIMNERVREQLQIEARDRFAIALSNEIVRFNIILIDEKFCVFQPYLPQARGVDSPTFVADSGFSDAGFFYIFEQVFTSLWKRARIILCRLMLTYCGPRTPQWISRAASFSEVSQDRLPARAIAIWRQKSTTQLRNPFGSIWLYTLRPSPFSEKRRAAEFR